MYYVHFGNYKEGRCTKYRVVKAKLIYTNLGTLTTLG
jgi:hypothetical protein